MEKQVKSKKRVTDFAEVYTARRQVVDMVDLVSDSVKQNTSTVLEPACGNGNFLAEILERKLDTVKSLHAGPVITEWYALQAIASIYGVDIQADNVQECRARLFHQLTQTDLLWSSHADYIAKKILSCNIICGNTLIMVTHSGKPMVFAEWDIRQSGMVVRKNVLFSDMLANGGESTYYISKQYYRWLPNACVKSA